MRWPCLLVLLALPLPAARAETGRAALASGGTACGEVRAFCGSATATVHSTRPVAWRLVMASNHGRATDEETGTAVVLAATGECWTDSCTRGHLYADGTLVASSATVCT